MALETPSWLNLDFMQDILRRFEGDNSIEVVDIFSKPATNKGDNYTSDMLRVFLEFSRTLGDQKVTEKRSVVIKISPTLEGVRKDMIEKCKIFDTEISMMTDTLRKMNGFLGQRHRLSGHVLHVQKGNPSILVMEDLAPLGFRMADRQAGLDLAHCVLAIRGLARFHASSVALCEKEPQQKGLYNKGMFSNYHPAEVSHFFIAGVSALADAVEKWPELGKRYAEKLRALSECIYKKGMEVTKRNDDDFNVIIHGDFWVNNMLFKYNEDRKPIDHIFVDFQMCCYSSPALDLQYFLCTSPRMEVYENSRHTLLEEYHKTLCNTMKEIGCTVSPPTMVELERYMKERALYGMIAAFTVLPLVLNDKSEALDLDEMMSKDGSYQNPAYEGAIYRKQMIKRLPMYDEMGLLDL